jgi:hypothetical protein
MFKRVLFTLTALALGLPALAADVRDFGCLPPPPPPEGHVKKTVRVEIRGKLTQREEILWRKLIDERDDIRLPMPYFRVWEISVGGKTWTLDFGPSPELSLKAGLLEGQTVVLEGTVEGDAVRVTSLKEAQGDAFVKETVDVEIKGRLQGMWLELARTTDLRNPERHPPVVIWTVTAEGQSFTLDFGTAADVRKLAETFDGRMVVLTGTLRDGNVIVKTLKVDEAK